MVDEPRIERGFAAFGRNQQHVVFVRTDFALGNALGADRQGLDDPVERRTLWALDDLRSAAVNSRAREMKLLGRFYVERLTPDQRKFAQIRQAGTHLVESD